MYSTLFKFIIIIISIYSISLDSLLLYYLYNLEDDTCNCSIDWRHTYLKVISCIMITCASLILIMLYIKNTIQIFTMIILVSIFILLSLVNWPIFGSYIKYLDDIKCNCSITKLKSLHDFFYNYRYFQTSIVGLLVVIICLLMFSYFYNR